jgi:hypothetical protein
MNLDLEKVKADEAQRRKEEQLKLEKEKQRLHQLEMQQQQQQQQQQQDFNPKETQNEMDTKNVCKNDLNQLIEKIYTEESPVNEIIPYKEPTIDDIELSNNKKIIIKVNKKAKNNGQIVVTKTSPLVAADLNDDFSDFESLTTTPRTTTTTTIALKTDQNTNDKIKIKKKQNESLIDDSRYEMLKRVNDTMDTLKNELLNRNKPPRAPSLSLEESSKMSVNSPKSSAVYNIPVQREYTNSYQKTFDNLMPLMMNQHELANQRLHTKNKYEPFINKRSQSSSSRLYNQSQQQQHQQPINNNYLNYSNHLNRNVWRPPPPPMPNYKNINYLSMVNQNQRLMDHLKRYQPPTVCLNQKCSNCSKMLGQGSAMFIEKLNLAFHLKCFKCSVCNIPLGNGKEGTDVRVSTNNRLHCNNCFSNECGIRLSAV